MRTSWRLVGLVGLILLAEVCLFSPSYSKFFCGDSLYYFSHSLKEPSQIPHVFVTLDDLSSYRPLPAVLFSFGLMPWFGFDPRPYHLVALSAHLLTSLLVFLLLRRLVRSDSAALAGMLFFGA